MLCLRALRVLVYFEIFFNTFADEADGDAYPLMVERKRVQAKVLLELPHAKRAPGHGLQQRNSRT